jgi:hypothetical protein
MSEWSRLKAKLESAEFWTMPTQEQDFGGDGSEWIIEGVKNGEYHVVARWTPKEGSPYQSLGKQFVELSGATIKPLY